MFNYIDDIRVVYDMKMGRGTPVLLLHGWGANRNAMKTIYDNLVAAGRSVISIDLPGFGESKEPPPHYGIYHYAYFVKRFLEEMSIDKVVVLGHSFGGRIAIILAAQTNLCKQIILVDSAGMKPKRSLAYYIKVMKYKRAKKRNKDVSGYGSADYKALSPQMKTVFTRVVNQFLECELKKISCPTLIIFGEKDTDTPLYMAKRLEKRIKDSGLVVLENCGHFSYLDNVTAFNLILDNFIEES